MSRDEIGFGDAMLSMSPASLQRRMDRLAVSNDVGLACEESLQRRVDVVEMDVGGEAVDARIRAAGLGPEQVPPRRQQIRQDMQVGDAAGVGGIGLEAADALIVVALGVVVLGRLQALGSEVGMAVEQGLLEKRP